MVREVVDLVLLRVEPVQQRLDERPQHPFHRLLQTCRERSHGADDSVAAWMSGV